jgi:hypothetical protein
MSKQGFGGSIGWGGSKPISCNSVAYNQSSGSAVSGYRYGNSSRAKLPGGAAAKAEASVPGGPKPKPAPTGPSPMAGKKPCRS